MYNTYFKIQYLKVYLEIVRFPVYQSQLLSTSFAGLGTCFIHNFCISLGVLYSINPVSALVRFNQCVYCRKILFASVPCL